MTPNNIPEVKDYQNQKKCIFQMELLMLAWSKKAIKLQKLDQTLVMTSTRVWLPSILPLSRDE